MTTDDMPLVREYATQCSESAFAALVARYTNLVYSAALRQTRNPQLAEEVTQTVFILLARKAASLSAKTILTSWLYRATCYVSSSALKREHRRQHREQEAYMQSKLDVQAGVTWDQLSPLLDEAMLHLGQTDRDALVLRFFEGSSLQEVGSVLGASEDAVKKRVGRALEKLRKFFLKRGVNSTAAAIGETISANSIQIAPAALAKTVTVMALTKGATAGASLLTLAEATSKAMAWAKIKCACGVGAAVLLAGSVITVAVAGKKPEQPDPVALLKGVAAARNRIKSGEMEFMIARHDSKWNIQTNYSLLKVAFDGEKRRFEQIQRETVLTSMAPDAQKIVEAKRLELKGDDEALARLGLIRFQDAHYRTVYNGKALIRFDPSLDTTIDDPAKGSFTYIFDARTFGLADNLSIGSPIEDFLGYRTAQLVALAGKEIVDGIAAWHVRVQVNHTWRYEFWIDANHLTHVIKEESPNVGTTIRAKFDDQNPSDPLPVEIDEVQHFGGDPRPWETRMFRRHTHYNVPIEPKAFTLAGLDMPTGTPVVDVRIHRRIGYWTGKNLSEQFPRNAPPPQESQASTLQNNLASLEQAKTDGSFVDERKIVLRRVEIFIGAMVLISVGLTMIRHFKLFQK